MGDDQHIGATAPARARGAGPTITHVVASDTCVGCGACQVRTAGAIPVRINPFGYRQADLSGVTTGDLARGSTVCPFADETPDETTLAGELFGETTHVDHKLGRYREIYAARITDDDELTRSSSGSMTNTIVLALLEGGHVDGVIHVGPQTQELFSYVVSRTASEVASRRKSIYYSTSMADAVTSVRGDGKRYAFVGVPCFVTAARHLARQDEVLREQLKFFVGLVCGHLKSSAFAELFAWQLGVPPSDVAEVDFRVKVPGEDAGRYAFAVTDISGKRHQAPTPELLGGNWGHGMFQLNACNYCDDIFAETADVALGDAWLPEYRSDWRGMNVVAVRHPVIGGIIADAVSRGEVELHDLTPGRAADSQAANFRHRRDGLALRLCDDEQAGRWAPAKRVAPSDTLDPKRRQIVRARRELTAASHAAFRTARERGSLATFLDAIGPLVERYDSLAGPSVGQRLVGKAAGAVRRARRLVQRHA